MPELAPASVTSQRYSSGMTRFKDQDAIIHLTVPTGDEDRLSLEIERRVQLAHAA